MASRLSRRPVRVGNTGSLGRPARSTSQTRSVAVLDRERGVTAYIARTGQPFFARSTDELHRHAEWEGKYKMHQGGREPNAFLGIPLKVLVTGAEERTIGVLKIEDIRPNPHHPESYFTDQDIILAEMMGSVIMTVIQNMRLADDHLE